LTTTSAIVDSHCHAGLSWFEPIETLLQQMDRNGVEHAILIQMRGQANNDYLFECMRHYPDRVSVVVGLEADHPTATDTLARLVDSGACGVRLMATARSQGADPLAIWRRAASLGMAVSCLGTSQEFLSTDFVHLVQDLPELTLVLEHLGSALEHETVPPEAFRAVFSLARFPNVYIKVPGLGEFCTRKMPVSEPFAFDRPIPPLLDWALEAFGPARMMWGSDFPPVSAREGYANALHLTLDQFAHASQTERDLIFGDVARTVFQARR
jgi:predicted TIM-barrel fold metal-dependent hydrolase